MSASKRTLLCPNRSLLLRIGRRYCQGQRLSDTYFLGPKLAGKDRGTILRNGEEEGCNRGGPVRVLRRQADCEDSRGWVCVGGWTTAFVLRTVAIVPAEREGTRTVPSCRCEGHRLTGRWSSRARCEVDTRGNSDADR